MDIRVLTEEQFQALIADHSESIEREKRMLELTEKVNKENIAFIAGLIHYDKAEVAAMLHCSIKQVELFEKRYGLKGTRFGVRKVVYSVKNLLEFIEMYKEDIPQIIPSSFPRRRRR